LAPDGPILNPGPTKRNPSPEVGRLSQKLSSHKNRITQNQNSGVWRPFSENVEKSKISQFSLNPRTAQTDLAAEMRFPRP